MSLFPCNPTVELSEENLSSLEEKLEKINIEDELGYVYRDFSVEKDDNSLSSSPTYNVICKLRGYFEDKGELQLAKTDREDYADFLKTFNPYQVLKLVEELQRKNRTISQMEKQMDYIITSRITDDPKEMKKIKRYSRCHVCPNEMEGQVATYLRDHYNPCIGCSNLNS